MKPKVVIAANTAWYLANFRRTLIRALSDAGFEVVAAAPPDAHAGKLAAAGCRFAPLPMDNGGTNPLRDLRLLFGFLRLLRAERPEVFLGYTVKPNVYGSLAARWLGIPVINNVAGLGAAFVREGWLSKLVAILYRLALSRSRKVFFQNREDLRLFVESGWVGAEATDRLPGSGVDLDHFRFKARSPGKDAVFLLVARLLWDKGVGEYVEAARHIKRRHPEARFQLLGFTGVENPSAVPKSAVDGWVAEGVVEYLGSADDVRPFIEEAECVVLPSYYREGVPRSLLESAAIGRAIITTDAPGCRDVVEDGKNGYLCRPRDAENLAETMSRYLSLPVSARADMGRKGREKMEREFDEQIVIRRYLEEVGRIVP